MLVFAFQKRELIDRTAGHAERAWTTPVEWHAINHRLLCAVLPVIRPFRCPYVNGFRRDIKHTSRRAEHCGRVAFEIAICQVTSCYRVQRESRIWIDGALGTIDVRRSEERRVGRG